MRRFHTCVCSTLHLPPGERRFIERLIAASRAGQSMIEHTDLTIVSHHDGYMVHVGVLEDHADRPAGVPPTLWRLLDLAFEEGASWLSFDREELPSPGVPTYADDPPPAIGTSGAVAVRCRTCGSGDVIRDAWARWDEAMQAWTLGSTFDAAFCNACEADAALVETALETPDLEHAA